MGAVWAAEQDHPVKRRVAVKLIKPGMDSARVVARFEAERQALALMDHTNIAKVFDAGTTDAGRPYFVMELVKGVPITTYCDNLRLPVRDRLGLFVQVCRAVQHAHQKGVIHRDLKPSNILVAVQDGKPVPKVIDFGVAKALHTKLADRTMYTEVGAVIGTLEYMAPEQAELSALDIDTRADVYALGVILYELLTGTTPLTRERVKTAGFTEVLRLIREEEPAKPSTRLGEARERIAALAANRRTEPKRLAAEVRGELDWIALKCLEKDRTRRYETASGLAKDVERYLADEPVEAGPPSGWYRVRKFARRNRRTVAAAAVVTLALVGGAAGATWGLVRALRAESAADRDRNRAVGAEADSEAFNGYVTHHLLAAARPSRAVEGLGRNIRLADALEAAEKKFEAAFAGRPRAEAKARYTLGMTWLGLGQFARAEEHLRRAADVYEQLHGPDAREALAARGKQAQALRQMGRTADARAVGEAAHARQAEVLGPDDRDTLDTLTILGHVYRDGGDGPKALDTFRRAAERYEAVYGPDHPETLTALNNLALGMEAVSGRLNDEVFDLVRRVYDRRVAVIGPDHPDTLLAMNNLAVQLKARSRMPESIALYERAVEKMNTTFGPDHAVTLTTTHNLAVNYLAARRVADGAKLLERVVERRTAVLGATHKDTLVSTQVLAVAYRATGRPREAVTLHEQVVRRLEAEVGVKHPEYLAALGNLAGSYTGVGRTADAFPLQERILERRRADKPPGHPDLLLALVNLAETHVGLGQDDKAEPLLREALAHRRPKGPKPVFEMRAVWLFAGLLTRQEKYADAEPLFRDYIRVVGSFNPNDPDVAAANSLLGGCLTARGAYPEAEPLLAKGYEGLKRSEAAAPPRGKSRGAAAADRLVRLYDAWGKPAEAAKWRAVRAGYDREPAPPPRPAK
jgi:tetratricopeptide (TPR) repeat protein/tRNA A-37 threonylcarbamoyl transferase component Bud32